MHGAQKTSRENDGRFFSCFLKFARFTVLRVLLPSILAFHSIVPRAFSQFFGIFWFFHRNIFRRNKLRYIYSVTYENRIAPILVRVSLVRRFYSVSPFLHRATRCLQNVSTTGADAMAGIRCGRASFRQNLKISFGRACVGQLSGENLLMANVL